MSKSDAASFCSIIIEQKTALKNSEKNVQTIQMLTHVNIIIRFTVVHPIEQNRTEYHKSQKNDNAQIANRNKI